MKARDVMTRDVITVAPDASVLEAIRLMLQRRISGLPVVDASGALVGMLTEGDFMRRAELGTERHAPRWWEFLAGPGRMASDYVHAKGRNVHDVMTGEVYSAGEDTPLTEIVDTMERRRIKRVPVMRGGKLVGIITRSNLLRALAGLSHATAPASAGDAAIREALVAELEQQSWAPLAGIDVVVAEGVVSLSGAIFDERQRHALRVAAENLPGVKKVEDHLVWIEPMSGTVIEAPTEH
ncbi:MAG: CBS domain-containing protein [Alphaproteobacteria bacterium]|nr:MAG: CBS domain-containing protein [Alphaproteobacteria bacterium]